MEKALFCIVFLLLLPTESPLAAQGPERRWTLHLSGTLTAYSLDLSREPTWRRAMSGRLRMVFGEHLHLEVAATSPTTSSKDNFVCPDAEVSACGPSEREKEFTVLTGGVGLHSKLGRFTPFLGVGGGRIQLHDQTQAVWLLYSGMEFQILEALRVFSDYRLSRVAWRSEGIGLNQEWSIGVSVDLIPHFHSQVR